MIEDLLVSSKDMINSYVLELDGKLVRCILNPTNGDADLDGAEV